MINPNNSITPKMLHKYATSKHNVGGLDFSPVNMKEREEEFKHLITDSNRISRQFIPITDKAFSESYKRFKALHQNVNIEAMDTNFAFVSTTLAKLHTEVYLPLYNTTYRKDVPIDVGTGFVDFVEYYTINWGANNFEEDVMTGNDVNIINSVNANIEQNVSHVHTYQIGYDFSFVTLEKLNKTRFGRSIQDIYSKAILATFDYFVDKIAYFGKDGTSEKGLLNNNKVKVYTVPTGVSGNNNLKDLTNAELISFINGVIKVALEKSNNNLQFAPDTFLIPMDIMAELADRHSPYLNNSLIAYIQENNFGSVVARATGEEYNLKLLPRVQLNDYGTLGGGRIVAYKKDKNFVRMDMPLPLQHFITLPSATKQAYTSIFVGQISTIQLMYNNLDAEGNPEYGPVTYWDMSPAQ